MNRSAIDPQKLIHTLITKQKAENDQFSLLVNSLLEGSIITGIEDLRFDHIRFLTAELPSMGRAHFEQVLLLFGYESSGYEIKHQAITTYSYIHRDPFYPRVDIDIAEMHRLPAYLRKIVQQYADQVHCATIANELRDQAELYDFLFSPRWSRASLGHYKVLREDHPMLAFLIHHQCPVSNCILKIDALPDGYNTYKEFLEFLKGIGLQLDRSRELLHTQEGGAFHTFNTVPSKSRALFADGEEVEIEHDFLMLGIKNKVVKARNFATFMNK